MKFIITRSSEWGFEEERDINSLEDLKNLQKEFKEKCANSQWSWDDPKLIVDFDKSETEIYDGYRE